MEGTTKASHWGIADAKHSPSQQHGQAVGWRLTCGRPLQLWVHGCRYEDLPIALLLQQQGQEGAAADPQLAEGLARIQQLDQRLRDVTLSALAASREADPAVRDQHHKTKHDKPGIPRRSPCKHPSLSRPLSILQGALLALLAPTRTHHDSVWQVLGFVRVRAGQLPTCCLRCPSPSPPPPRTQAFAEAQRQRLEKRTAALQRSLAAEASRRWHAAKLRRALQDLSEEGTPADDGARCVAGMQPGHATSPNQPWPPGALLSWEPLLSCEPLLGVPSAMRLL